MCGAGSVALVKPSGSVTLTLCGETKTIEYTHRDVHRISWDRATVEAGAELEWRLRFSRMVFHMELLEPRESQRNMLKDEPFEFVVDEQDSASDPFHLIRATAPPLKRGTSTAGVAKQWVGGLSKRYSSFGERSMHLSKRQSSVSHMQRALVSRSSAHSLWKMPAMIARMSNNEGAKDSVGKD